MRARELRASQATAGVGEGGDTGNTIEGNTESSSLSSSSTVTRAVGRWHDAARRPHSSRSRGDNLSASQVRHFVRPDWKDSTWAGKATAPRPEWVPRGNDPTRAS
jgi:hypothetical protein